MQKTIYYSKKYRMNEETRQPVENKRFFGRKTKLGSLIIAACLVLALGTAMIIPLLMSGAGVPQSSRPASAHAAENTSVAVYASAADAMQALGITAALPAYLPEGYAERAVNVLDGQVLEVIFANGGKEIVFRAAEGQDDVSGEDYNAFAYKGIEEAGGISRGYAGVSEKKLSLAVWTNGGLSYSLYFKNGTNGETMRAVAESII